MGCGPSRTIPSQSERRKRDSSRELRRGERRQARNERSRHGSSRTPSQAEAGPSNHNHRVQPQKEIELTEMTPAPDTGDPAVEATTSMPPKNKDKGKGKGKEKDTTPYPAPSVTTTASQPGRSNSTRHHGGGRSRSRSASDGGRADRGPSGSVRGHNSHKDPTHQHNRRQQSHNRDREIHRTKDKDRTKGSGISSSHTKAHKRTNKQPPRATNAPVPQDQEQSTRFESLPPLSLEALADPTPSLINHHPNIIIPPQEGIHNPFGGDPPTSHVQDTLYAHVHTPTPKPSQGLVRPTWVDIASDSDEK